MYATIDFCEKVRIDFEPNAPELIKMQFVMFQKFIEKIEQLQTLLYEIH
jgi:hypothetical protein